MTDKQFYTLFGAALRAEDREIFVSACLLSEIWGDQEDEIPPGRADDLGQLWDVAHVTIRDIRAHTGLTQAAFSTRCCIPRRTIEEWEAGRRTCPNYLRLLLAQAAGMYSRP